MTSAEITEQTAWQVYKDADCLYDNDQVQAAIERMAVDISATIKQYNPLVVCIMNGGLIPCGLLLPRFHFPLQLDYVHASRYDGQLQGSELQWLSEPRMNASGRTVLLIDDIVDAGATLAATYDYYLQLGAAKVYTAVLVVKQRKRTTDVVIDFSGLTVPDRYVFGYGMDYKNYLRNVPGIYAVGNS